jgi:hypothetical protein
MGFLPASLLPYLCGHAPQNDIHLNCASVNEPMPVLHCGLEEKYIFLFYQELYGLK